MMPVECRTTPCPSTRRGVCNGRPGDQASGGMPPSQADLPSLPAKSRTVTDEERSRSVCGRGTVVTRRTQAAGPRPPIQNGGCSGGHPSWLLARAPACSKSIVNPSELWRFPRRKLSQSAIVLSGIRRNRKRTVALSPPRARDSVAGGREVKKTHQREEPPVTSRERKAPKRPGELLRQGREDETRVYREGESGLADGADSDEGIEKRKGRGHVPLRTMRLDETDLPEACIELALADLPADRRRRVDEHLHLAMALHALRVPRWKPGSPSPSPLPRL